MLHFSYSLRYCWLTLTLGIGPSLRLAVLYGPLESAQVQYSLGSIDQCLGLSASRTVTA